MSVALACTWNPRGELPRLQRAIPLLVEAYAKISVCLPPHTDRSVVETLNTPLVFRMFFSPDWAWGRHLAVADALDSSATHIQYVDMDELDTIVEALRPNGVWMHVNAGNEEEAGAALNKIMKWK